MIHARNGYFALPPEARAGGLQPFEVPLLKILSDATVSDDVKFRAGAVLLQPKAEGTSVAVLVEVPLHELQPKPGPAKAMLDVHCSLARPGEGRQGRSGSEADPRPRVSGDSRPIEVGQLPGQDDGHAACRESTAWKAR